MFERAKHYVTNHMPAGTVLSDEFRRVVCPNLSAGHLRHEYTTGYAFEEIIKQFKYLKEQEPIKEYECIEDKDVEETHRRNPCNCDLFYWLKKKFGF